MHSTAISFRSGLLAALLLWNATSRAWGGEAPLTKVAGVYSVSVKINGAIDLDFVVDSGAAEVSVPADVALTLIRTRTVSESDFLPGATYRLADGSEIQSPRFIIRSLQVGGKVVRNVPAAIGEITSQLLLGQSVLERLGSWSMDMRRGVLTFADAGDTSPLPSYHSTPSPDRGERDAWGELPPPAAATALTSPEASPVDTVHRYYDLIREQQYPDAWNAMSEGYRNSLRYDFAGWVAGFRTTRGVSVTSTVLAESSANSAIVLFSLESIDAADDGSTITKSYQGQWTLERFEGRWVLAKPKIRRVQ